jgi:diketogulonate reductase-like aldo/keto reductase
MSKSLPLIDGLTIPQMGFGTYGLRNGEDVILHALRTGYRHIDTADMYGTHGDVGAAMRRSGLARAEIFVTTKLWSHSVSRGKVGPAVDRFLDEMGLEYIDLLLIHWPARNIPAAETLGAMEEARRAGKIRAAGVSNFNVAQMKDALATGVPVCNNQIEYNIEERPDDIVEFCQANKVTVTAYSPVKVRGNAKTQTLLGGIAKQHNCTAEEVILAWLLAKGLIVIPRSSNPKHIESNFRALELKLSSAELQQLETAG